MRSNRKSRENTNLDFFYFAREAARSGFLVGPLLFVITNSQIRIIGWEDLEPGLCVSHHIISWKDESGMIEIYPYTNFESALEMMKRWKSWPSHLGYTGYSVSFPRLALELRVTSGKCWERWINLTTSPISSLSSHISADSKSGVHVAMAGIDGVNLSFVL